MAGGDAVVGTPAAQATRGRQQKASLPFDVLLEIAARTDPSTFIRCAATYRDMRRRVVDDPAFLSRVRFQRTDRFVLPLLLGHLTGPGHEYDIHSGRADVHLVDTTAAESTKLTRVIDWGFPPGGKPLDSRDGLVLVRTPQNELMVFDPATLREQTLPPAPDGGDYYEDPRRYVLLVGDGGEGSSAVGRPFRVVKAKLVLSEHLRAARCLIVQTFSSAHGAWGSTTIPTPSLDGRGRIHRLALQDGPRPLVVGDIVHWLCLTRGGSHSSYVLMLHVGAARATVTALPASFPFPHDGNHELYLLATTSPGGSPCVLVADGEKLSAWVHCTHTKRWKQQPQVVIDNVNDAVARFVDSAGGFLEDEEVPPTSLDLEMVYFGESSGAVLMRARGTRRRVLVWLDLQSKRIVRCFTSSDRRVKWYKAYCPYERRLS